MTKSASAPRGARIEARDLRGVPHRAGSSIGRELLGVLDEIPAGGVWNRSTRSRRAMAGVPALPGAIHAPRCLPRPRGNAPASRSGRAERPGLCCRPGSRGSAGSQAARRPGQRRPALPIIRPSARSPSNSAIRDRLTSGVLGSASTRPAPAPPPGHRCRGGPDPTDTSPAGGKRCSIGRRPASRSPRGPPPTSWGAQERRRGSRSGLVRSSKACSQRSMPNATQLVKAGAPSAVARAHRSPKKLRW